jgi:lipopolysaccharide heptosyltransferase II
MRPNGNRIERVLVRGTNWIGDAVMTTPALERLRSSFPQSQITLLATPWTMGLFENSKFFDQIIEYHRREAGFKAFIAAVSEIRARRFDLALLFQNAFEAALLAWMGGARLRIGFAGQGRGLLLTHQLDRGPEHRNRHQVHDYLDLVAECERVCFGQEPRPVTEKPKPSLTASTTQRGAAHTLLQSLGIYPNSRPLIALNAGATNSQAKCWPEDRFAALADRLVGELNGQVVLIGAPSERDIAENIIRQMKSRGAVNLAGRTRMAELIGLLDACDLLVSNDTGPAHIAAALGRPALTLFGPTNEFETAPAGPRAEIIRAEGIACARCMLRDCPIDHRCMTRITADTVFERSLALLKNMASEAAESAENRVK